MKRRNVIRTVAVGGATVMAPEFVDVSSAATDSGSVELTTTTTIPTNTAIDVTIYEDTTGDGASDRQQTETITAGTDVVTIFDALNGSEGQGYTYWMDVSLSTSDDTVTPEMDAATITLPEEPQTATQTPIPEKDPQTISEMWDNYLLYVATVIGVFTGIGMASRSLAIGALGGYLVFAYIALETGTAILSSILYVTLVLIFIGFAFKFWRLEMGGNG